MLARFSASRDPHNAASAFAYFLCDTWIDVPGKCARSRWGRTGSQPGGHHRPGGKVLPANSGNQQPADQLPRTLTGSLTKPCTDNSAGRTKGSPTNFASHPGSRRETVPRYVHQVTGDVLHKRLESTTVQVHRALVPVLARDPVPAGTVRLITLNGPFVHQGLEETILVGHETTAEAVPLGQAGFAMELAGLGIPFSEPILVGRPLGLLSPATGFAVRTYHDKVAGHLVEHEPIPAL